MRKQFTERELEQVKEFAYQQWQFDEDIISFYHEPSDTDIVNPWVDWESGWRGEFDTVEAIIKCYGEDVFYDFCERVLNYLES